MKNFHKRLLHWYSLNARNLPWRTTKNPYRILVSEMMLQQTQVSRVVGFYKEWFKKFPTLEILSRSSKKDVLRQWSGLGYNNRALRLFALSKIIVEEYHGKFPRSNEELRKLPGIGKYTASALECFSFGKNVAVVDVNIIRIYSRVLWKVSSAGEKQSEKIIWTIAEKYLPANNASVWNQALMDLGSAVCTARNPKCDTCPLNDECASAFSPMFQYPIATKKNNEPHYKNIPRRLYRGRILKLLHTSSLTKQRIAISLWKSFSRSDIAWLTSTLKQMKDDGLIRMNAGKVSIAE